MRLRFLALAVLILVLFQSSSSSYASPRVAVALKDFSEILTSYSEVTRISANDPEIQTLYKKVLGRLPKTGAISELKSPMLTAVVSLGSLFCQKMIAKDAAQADVGKRYLHQGVDFTLPSASQSLSTRRAVIQDYASIFWLRAATDAEVQKILDLQAMTEVQMASAPPSPQSLYLLACSFTASSAQFLLN